MVAVGQVKGPSKVLVTKLRLEELSSRMVNGFCFQCLAPSLAVTWTDRVQVVFLRRHPPLSGCHLQILRSVYRLSQAQARRQLAISSVPSPSSCCTFSYTLAEMFN